MQIRLAKPKYLSGINQLLESTFMPPITLKYINKRDLGLVALSHEKKVIGFLWCGIMACGEIGYLDKFVIDPEFYSRGLASILAQRMVVETAYRGVTRVFGIIKQTGEHHIPSAVNGFKVGMLAEPDPYTHIFVDPKVALEKLKRK